MKCTSCKRPKQALWKNDFKRMLCSDCCSDLGILVNEESDDEIPLIDLSSPKFQTIETCSLNSSIFTELPIGFSKIGCGKAILKKFSRNVNEFSESKFPLEKIHQRQITSTIENTFSETFSSREKNVDCLYKITNPDLTSTDIGRYINHISENEILDENMPSADAIMEVLMNELLFENTVSNANEATFFNNSVNGSYYEGIPTEKYMGVDSILHLLEEEVLNKAMFVDDIQTELNDSQNVDTVFKNRHQFENISESDFTVRRTDSQKKYRNKRSEAITDNCSLMNAEKQNYSACFFNSNDTDNKIPSETNISRYLTENSTNPCNDSKKNEIKDSQLSCDNNEKMISSEEPSAIRIFKDENSGLKCVKLGNKLFFKLKDPKTGKKYFTTIDNATKTGKNISDLFKKGTSVVDAPSTKGLHKSKNFQEKYSALKMNGPNIEEFMANRQHSVVKEKHKNQNNFETITSTSHNKSSGSIISRHGLPNMNSRDFNSKSTKNEMIEKSKTSHGQSNNQDKLQSENFEASHTLLPDVDISQRIENRPSDFNNNPNRYKNATSNQKSCVNIQNLKHENDKITRKSRLNSYLCGESNDATKKDANKKRDSSEEDTDSPPKKGISDLNVGLSGNYIKQRSKNSRPYAGKDNTKISENTHKFKTSKTERSASERSASERERNKNLDDNDEKQVLGDGYRNMFFEKSGFNFKIVDNKLSYGIKKFISSVPSDSTVNVDEKNLSGSGISIMRLPKKRSKTEKKTKTNLNKRVPEVTDIPSQYLENPIKCKTNASNYNAKITKNKAESQNISFVTNSTKNYSEQTALSDPKTTADAIKNLKSEHDYTLLMCDEKIDEEMFVSANLITHSEELGSPLSEEYRKKDSHKNKKVSDTPQLKKNKISKTWTPLSRTGCWDPKPNVSRNNCEKPKPCVKRKSAKPLHLARVEKALDVNQFLHSLKVSAEDTSSDSDEANNEELLGFKVADFITPTDYYNFSNVSGDRQWLADILQENTDSPPEEVQYQHILKLHSYQKNLRQGKKNFSDYMYYGAGLVSTIDHYAATEKTTPSPLSKKKKRDETSETPLYPSNMLEDIAEEPCLDLNLENGLDFQTFDEDSSNVQCNFNSSNMSLSSSSAGQQRKKVKKFKDEEAKKKWEDMMTIKRKRVFSNLIKKEVGKQQRSKSNRHKETLLQCKRVAQQCAKVVRQKAVLSARIVKEQQWRMKRLARENIAYWKRSRRLDREVKKRMEKEAEEQRKIDHELIEAKRQQRKLNFLITQTELYAHFMSKKLGTASAEEQLRILNQLDEEKNPRLAAIDEYDSEMMKEKAKKNAEEAFLNERTRTKHFDLEANSSFIEDLDQDGEQPQPKIFRGKLKGYQLRGMNWLANLYSQGISGILADEMGLGKTVQSIAFLCHIAEKYAVWGPFLIISPASTLHNWQQEIAKFVPSFKVVPYWGNPNERKILRQFWDQKDIYTKEASFHIVITSYQIVITDIKYFNRIKWQYMILDEAQAIKSTSSMRWKTLLGFSCRNRLLLSGTPIQNSMAELWALLHFIMPTLFDSHEEFNEWFSKDIESHAENKTGIDEKHLSRLHMILKPFMLRRIKKDVENELSDKIEIMVYCPLTTRQKLLYIALKQKIKIEDLIHYSVGGGDAHSVDKNFTSNLMNLVMQFRKVCNHPELFERRDAKSPITPTSVMYQVPRLIYDLNLLESNFLLMQKYFLFTCKYIASAVINDSSSTIFNFCLDMNLSFDEIYQIFQGNILQRWQHYYYSRSKERLTKFIDDWSSPVDRKPSLNIVCHTSLYDDLTSNLLLQDFIFTRNNCASRVVYGHAKHTYFSTSELNYMDNLGVSQEIDMESSKTDDIQISKLCDSNMKFIKEEYTSSELPSFLSSIIPKIQNCNITLYCSSRRAAHAFKRHTDEFSYSSLNFYWSGATGNEANKSPAKYLYPTVYSPIDILRPINGWSNIYIPDKETLVTDAGKLSVLDSLLKKLKKEGHRVLIYSQMTKMIDLLEEYMWHRHHKYMRLDGSSKISERRDMVADFQARTDIFVFLLSTRAGGLGINLTAADTVIFYDSDWNPTVDQQAMDRAHRLGQTKQVTVYRLICKGTIEERILQRAREKSEIQKLVISGGNFKPDTLKPKEVVSLLLDEEELVQKFHKSSAKVEQAVVPKIEPILVQDAEKRKRIEPPFKTISAAAEPKRLKMHDTNFEDQFLNVDSTPTSPQSVTSNDVLTDDLSDASFFEDNEGSLSSKYTVYNVYGSAVKPRTPARGSSKRGRPRGSRRASTLNRMNSGSATSGIFTSGSDMSIGDANATHSSNAAAENSGTAGMSSPVSTVRRGPGRPRLKPSGPLNTSTRGTYKPRKPTRPLPVPLPSDGTNTTSSSSHLYSSYVFDFPEQPDS